MNIHQITQFLADVTNLYTSSGESYGDLYTIEKFNEENNFNVKDYNPILDYYGFGQFLIDGNVVSVSDGYGGEGQGDDYWTVIKVGDLGFIQILGSYSSWEGIDLTNIDVVYPKEVTKIVWKHTP